MLLLVQLALAHFLLLLLAPVGSLVRQDLLANLLIDRHRDGSEGSEVHHPGGKALHQGTRALIRRDLEESVDDAQVGELAVGASLLKHQARLDDIDGRHDDGSEGASDGANRHRVPLVGRHVEHALVRSLEDVEEEEGEGVPGNVAEDRGSEARVEGGEAASLHVGADHGAHVGVEVRLDGLLDSLLGDADEGRGGGADGGGADLGEVRAEAPERLVLAEGVELCLGLLIRNELEGTSRHSPEHLGHETLDHVPRGGGEASGRLAAGANGVEGMEERLSAEAGEGASPHLLGLGKGVLPRAALERARGAPGGLLGGRGLGLVLRGLAAFRALGGNNGHKEEGGDRPRGDSAPAEHPSSDSDAYKQKQGQQE
mmetsp:Transcript_14856/g.37220  ORF Transcript_14856/g.37220 Transcript_14856/m.37220 type:complete len:371 (+) Transcript_14856:164-1276(+)